MYFTKSTIAAILGFSASYAAASPIVERQESLEPWLLQTLSHGSPSGRPGEAPWAVVQFNITDPNAIQVGDDEQVGPVISPAGSLGYNCRGEYLYRTSSPPYGHRFRCSNQPAGEGYWSFEFVEGSEGSFSSGNFNLKVTRVVDIRAGGGRYTKTFSGTKHFQVGDNMSGSCGGSGVCGWSLKPELRPYPFQQAEEQ